MLKVAICDDSQSDLNKLEAIALKNKFLGEVDCFSTGLSLLDYMEKSKTSYNIFLLDVELPVINGIELAKNIRKFDDKALIVFITSYKDYVMDVFQIHTFDYILKPFRENQISSVFERANNYLSSTKTYFEFSSKWTKKMIKADEIIYFEKMARSCYVYTLKKCYKFNASISQIISKLDLKVFCQIHGSYIVNLKYVEGVRCKRVLVKNYDNREIQPDLIELPLSRKFRPSFNDKMSQYARKRF